MPTTTPNYGFNQPLVGDPTDEDLWGGYLNGNWGSADIIIKGIADSLPAAIPAGLGPLPYSGTSAPTGWLECNGAAVSRSTYAALFTAIGTTFGTGNGSTTFNLPAMARRTAVGRGGTSTSTLGNTIGSAGGAESVTLTVAQMPAHDHDMDYITNLSGIDNGRQPRPAGTGTATQSTRSTGGGQSHNNLPPSLVTMMIIKT